jgi:DinB family protein
MEGMPVLPPDLQELATDLEKADRTADTLVQDLTDEQFHWRPDEGRRWSIALCLDHLATANTVYGEAIRTAIESARHNGWTRQGAIAPTIAGRMFVRSLEPPVKRKSQAPAKIRPRGTDDRVEIMRRYHAAHRDIGTLIESCASIDVNRATFQNPFVPLVRMRVGTGLRVIAAHDRRHLWQAQRVTEAPGFPQP